VRRARGQGRPLLASTALRCAPGSPPCSGYTLPVGLMHMSEYSLRILPSDALRAAQQVEALRAAVQATPSVPYEPWMLDFELWCAP